MDFNLLETIHRGKYSAVHKAEKLRSIKNIFALKSFDKSHENKVPQEVIVHKSLDHPNIVKYYDWCETSTDGCLILEYCVERDLWRLLKQGCTLSEDEVHDIAQDLVGGLRYLHSKGIIHCDLKPSNILFDGHGHTKICDFGLSRELSDISSKTPSSLLLPEAKKRGTPSYMAPELFDDGGVHSFASDFWALGCVLYECYAGRPPFVGKELTQLVNSILTDPTPSIPGNPSRPFADLVSRLLMKDPKDRIQWSEICTHAFWGTEQLSPVVFPPQPAFDNMIQQLNEDSTGVNLLRLSRIAKSNLQKNDTTDVKIENRDMELDFTPTEYGDESEVAEDSPQPKTQRRVSPLEVLWHDSDLSVVPVMPSDKKQSDVLPSTLPFDAIPSSDFVKLTTDELDVFIKSIVTILDNVKTPIREKQNVIRYLEMLSTNQDTANILINSSIMPVLVKMLRQSKVSALRVQLASLIGLLISHSTFINDNLSNSGILDALKTCVEDNRQEKEVRRFSMAALGELLFYISTTQDDLTNPPETPSKENKTSSWWKVSDKFISLVTSVVRNEEDNLTQLYALRTIENMSGEGGYWSACFTTEDVINNLCDIFRDEGKQEAIRLAAGSCLVRLLCFTPRFIQQVMEKLTFKETAKAITGKNPKEQNICLNLLNVSILGCKFFPKEIGHHLHPLMKVKKLVPSLVSLVANDDQVLRGKSLLLVTLLCKNRRRWLSEFILDGKLLSVVDRLVVVGVYLQQCLEVFLGGVVAEIPGLLEIVISDLQQPTALTVAKSKTNIQLLAVVLNLVESCCFKHKFVNAEEVLQQLKKLIKLVESPFEGRDDFQFSVVRIFETIAEEASLFEQNPMSFVCEILPSVSIICKGSKNENLTFFCLKIWFQLVVYLLIDSSSEELIPICNDHFLPLYPQLKKNKSLRDYAKKLHDILLESKII